MENPPLKEDLLKIDGATSVEFLTDRQLRLFFSGDQEITERVIAASMNGGWKLREITLDKSALDEIFKQLSGKSRQAV
jgi:ABC-2 type transport system ATP-binding protein